MKKEQTLKELISQLKKYEGELDGLKNEINNKKNELLLKKKIISNLNNKIADINKILKKSPKVSEHALLRYIERVKGININDCEKEILNDKILKLIETLGGNGSYPNDNFKIVMKDNVVVTITT